MGRENIHDESPFSHAIYILGGKWKPLIVYNLSEGGLRYNQLKRRINGISNIMLTRSLQSLEEYGLVIRVQHTQAPLNVEYALSEHAKKLCPVIRSMEKWGEEQMRHEKL
jgi:DNA-binding HxlR family transcriptional regulator